MNLYLVLSASESFTLGEILLKMLFGQCVARVLCVSVELLFPLGTIAMVFRTLV